MVKKALFFLLLIALFICVFAVLENDPRSVVGSLMKEGIPAATAVNFEVKLFGFLPVGDAIVENKGITAFREENVYNIALIARSKDIFSKFFKAELKVSSYVSPESLLPVYYKESIKINGNDKGVKEILYSNSRGIMIADGERIGILPGTFDPLSAFNYVRQLDFDAVKYFDLNINSNQRNYIFRGEVDEIIYRLNNKDIKVWRLTGDIRRRDKDPGHASKVKMWILDNKNRTPVFIKIASGRMFYSARVSHIK
ncbi:MAG: DUF3108 domain-containing protein [Candidatus Omnitrophica bacterium]|nr:DUF3108 domain-containing protein [Candidatus Omnitrophota bacterium]